MKKKYIYADGQILCQHDVPDNNEKYFYLHDRLGSVRFVIDDTGAAKNSYMYNPFGEMFPTECSENVNVTNPFKFTGQYFDDEIGQYYLRARMYDPALMRFTARDPVMGKEQEPLTLHKYLYCNNDPINRIDPTGKFNFSLPDIVMSTVCGAMIGGTGGFFGGLIYEIFNHHAENREFNWGNVWEKAAWGAMVGGIGGGGFTLTTGIKFATEHFLSRLAWAAIGGEISGAYFGAKKLSLSYVGFRNVERQVGMFLLIDSMNKGEF